MKNFLTISLIIITLIGCSQITQLTQHGRLVRTIHPDWTIKCKFLGVIDAAEYNGWTVVENKKGVLNQIRNKVADLGGDAFIISQNTSDSFGSYIQAEVYVCH